VSVPPETTRQPRCCEFGRGGFLEADGFSRDDVHQRSALNSGEDGFIDGGAVLLLRENHAAAWAAQSLVRGGSDDIGVLARIGMELGGDQAGEMRHIDQQQRAHRIGDLAKARKIEDARIGAAAGDDHFRLVLFGQARDLVVIDTLVFAAHVIRDHVIGLAREIQVMAVREMAAMRKIEAEDGVAGLQHRCVRRLIRLRAGVRLDVGVFGVEQRFRAIPGQVFERVGVLASAVVAAARIAFGVLVGEHARGGFEHGFGSKIFAGDQLQPRVLALGFLLNQLENLGVGGGEGPRHSLLFRGLIC